MNAEKQADTKRNERRKTGRHFAKFACPILKTPEDHDYLGCTSA